MSAHLSSFPPLSHPTDHVRAADVIVLTAMGEEAAIDAKEAPKG